MKKLLFFAAMIFLYCLSAVSHAEFYKWVDENGVTRISNAGVPEKYKDKSSKAEEAKYADQPQQVEPQKENKENIVIINNMPAPAAVNNTPVVSNQKNDLNEKVRLERNRLQELIKSDGPSHYNGRGYTSQEKEFFDSKKDKAKKDLEFLNKNPEQYFYNKAEKEKNRRINVNVNVNR